MNPVESVREQAGRPVAIPVTIEAAAMSPITVGSAPSDYARRGSTRFFAMVEEKIAAPFTSERIKKSLMSRLQSRPSWLLLRER